MIPSSQIRWKPKQYPNCNCKLEMYKARSSDLIPQLTALDNWDQILWLFYRWNWADLYHTQMQNMTWEVKLDSKLHSCNWQNKCDLSPPNQSQLKIYFLSYFHQLIHSSFVFSKLFSAFLYLTRLTYYWSCRILNLRTHINYCLRKPPLQFSHDIIHIRLSNY